jgi:hypothetical protein
VGPAFVHAFQHALGWVAAVLAVIFLLMFALPKQPAQHVEGAQDETDVQDQGKDVDQGRKPEFVG